MLDQRTAEQFLETMATTRIAGDVQGLVQLFDDNARFAIVGFGSPVTGRHAIQARLQDLVTQFEFLEWKRIKAVVNGDEIAAQHRLKVKYCPTGQVSETNTAEFLTMRGGLCTSFVQFADTALIAGMAQTAS